MLVTAKRKAEGGDSRVSAPALDLPPPGPRLGYCAEQTGEHICCLVPLEWLPMVLDQTLPHPVFLSALLTAPAYLFRGGPFVLSLTADGEALSRPLFCHLY